jgi:1-acyl-sn-glycerol-3-phosphate acyltransferase
LRPFWKFYLYCIGWKSTGPNPNHLNKYVMIVAPHTSGQDVIILIAFRSVLRLKNARFLAKKELFKPPFGFIFRWLDATPVDRTDKQNMVDQVVELYNKNEKFALALSPEGTRKKVERLHTGFYHIAKKAAVPLVMVALDFANKQLIFSGPFYTSNDQAADFQTIINFFGPVQGKNPALGLSHLLQVNPK